MDGCQGLRAGRNGSNCLMGMGFYSGVKGMF